MDALVDGVIRFVVPGVPRGAQRARSTVITPRNRPSFISTYTPTETRAEQSAIRLFAATAMAGRPPLEGPLDLRISAYFSVPASWSGRKRALALSDRLRPTGKPDHDNIDKLICDSLKGVTWLDDSQVTDAHLWKRYAREPRITVEIRQIVLAMADP